MRRYPWGHLLTDAALRTRILVTLGLLVLYRLAAHVVVPGVDRAALADTLGTALGQDTILGLLDLFSGGAVARLSVVALGVYPYIAAQAVIKFWLTVNPSLKSDIESEGWAGRRRVERWSLLAMAPLALLQSFGLIRLLAADCGAALAILPRFGFVSGDWLFTAATLITMTAGAFFAVWVADLIGKHGIGGGVNLILFSGIAVGLPQEVAQVMAVESRRWESLAIYSALVVITLAAVVVMGEGKRKVPVLFPRRQRRPRRESPGTYIPLSLLYGGTEALTAGQALLSLPAFLAHFLTCAEAEWVRRVAEGTASFFSDNSSFFWPLTAVLVAAFTFLYTGAQFEEQNISEVLRRQNASIPGVRPGDATRRYLWQILQRITLLPAVFLGLIVITPWLAGALFGIPISLLAGEELFIVANTVKDSLRVVEADLMTRHYEPFIQ